MITKSTTVSAYLSLSMFYDLKEYENLLIESGKPESVAGNKTPDSLDNVTYSQRIDLSEIKTESGMLFLPCKILFNMDRTQILTLPIMEVIGLSMWVIRELNRLNEREKRTLKYNPEPEELKAGINELSFGAFGVIDSIVKSRPVYTHEDVLQLSVAKVYAMQLIDHKQNMFQKRLRNEYSQKK